MGCTPTRSCPHGTTPSPRRRQAGDRDLARAIGRLRRPTRAAWLANLLARERPDQLDGLLALAGDLASAQRTLDGSALRALSAQRNRLVTAMAREGGRLAAQAGDSATESVVRDLAGILEAALADPAVADEVRSGRLTRTVSYSGFGPGPGSAGGRDANGTAPTAADERPGTRRAGRRRPRGRRTGRRRTPVVSGPSGNAPNASASNANGPSASAPSRRRSGSPTRRATVRSPPTPTGPTPTPHTRRRRRR